MFSLAVTDAFAQRPGRQGPPDPETVAERIENRVASLTEALDLSEEQQSQVREIYTDVINQRREFMASRESGDRGRQAAREEMAQFDQQLRSRLKAVLTAEQFSKYQELRPRRQGDQRMRERPGRSTDGERPRGMRGDRPMGWLGGPNVAAIQERLNLTDEQISEIRNILQDARSEMRANRRQAERPDRAEFLALAQTVQEQISRVLTEKQLERLSELRSEYQNRWEQKRSDRRKNG